MILAPPGPDRNLHIQNALEMSRTSADWQRILDSSLLELAKVILARASAQFTARDVATLSAAALLKELLHEAAATLVVPQQLRVALDQFCLLWSSAATSGPTEQQGEELRALRLQIVRDARVHSYLISNAMRDCLSGSDANSWFAIDIAKCVVAAVHFALRRANAVAAEMELDLMPSDALPPCRSRAYNPPLDGAAYYFTEDGSRIRDIELVKGLDETSCRRAPAVDDSGLITCKKVYAQIRGKAYVMFFLCPEHGHCWGELLIFV